MKRTLKENGGLPASLLWTLAILAGVSVANLYYNQPLLNVMSTDLQVPAIQTNRIAMLSQIGYAVGLLFIIPLADLYQRKKIILVSYSLLIAALLITAISSNIHIILAASFVTGVCSMVPQIFIPIASQFSEPANKGRNVGIVLSGLLTGILVSRVISGFVGEIWGWRAMYYIAAGLMSVSAIAVIKIMPDISPNFRGKYSELMTSLLSLLRTYPQASIYSVRAGLCFGTFLALWSCLAFKMGEAPFYANSNIIGMLGLCGVVGAMLASVIGKYIKQVGVRRFNIIGSLLIFAAWASLYWGQNSYVTIIAGIILIDIGMQCVQLSNQTSIFELCPSASNRMNTIFMTTYFVGGSLGTLLAGFGWEHFGWAGVAAIGCLFTFLSLAITLIYRRE